MRKRLASKLGKSFEQLYIASSTYEQKVSCEAAVLRIWALNSYKKTIQSYAKLRKRLASKLGKSFEQLYIASSTYEQKELRSSGFANMGTE